MNIKHHEASETLNKHRDRDCGAILRMLTELSNLVSDNVTTFVVLLL